MCCREMFNVNKNFTKCQQQWKFVSAMMLENLVLSSTTHKRRVLKVLRTLPDIVKISVVAVQSELRNILVL